MPSHSDRSQTGLEAGTKVPSALHVRSCSDAREFIAAWSAQPDPARRLWEVVEAGGAVALQLSDDKARELGTSTGVICRIAATTGGGTNRGAYLLRDGACARDVERLIRNRNRLVDHRSEARFKQTDADVESLSEQIQLVNRQLMTRDVLDTAFDKEWVPRSMVTRVVVSDAAIGERSTSDPSRQTSLEGI